MPELLGRSGSRVRTRVRRVGFASFLVAVIVATGTAVAGERPRPERGSEDFRDRLLRLGRERLAPGVSIEMEALSSARGFMGSRTAVRDHVLSDQMTDSVRGRAKSLARRAARDYLLETTRLDRSIRHIRTIGSFRRLRDRVGGPGAAGADHRPGGGDLDLSVGFSHMLPEVGVRYRAGSRSLGLSVGADGAVGVSFANGRDRRARVGASFDGRDEYRVGARFSF